MLEGSVGISGGGACNCRNRFAGWLGEMAGSAENPLLAEYQESHSFQQKLHGYYAHASSSRP